MGKRCSAALLALVLGRNVAAQSRPSTFEVGARFSVLRLGSKTTEAGLGGWLTYNATANLALEGEVAFFPQDKDDVLKGGRKIEMLAGLKAGARLGRLGLFGKFRAGAVRFGEGRQPPGVVCILIFPPAPGCHAADTRLALDVGGVLEVNPSSKSLVRVDLGDTILRVPPAARLGRHDGEYTNNLQVSGGIGFRF